MEVLNPYEALLESYKRKTNEEQSLSKDDVRKEIVDLMNRLNYFCFHGSGADDNCCGCPFEGESPCPLAIFHAKLVGKL